MITSLLDTQKFRANLLAASYHQRWEVENTIDEFKVHLLERKTHVRSQRPREVVQEIYGLLLGHARCTVINLSSSASCRDFTPRVFPSRVHYELFVVPSQNFSD